MFDLSTKKITEAMQKTSYNYKIAEYYQTLYMMTDQEKYSSKCIRISNCYKYFDIDLYKSGNDYYFNNSGLNFALSSGFVHKQ